MQVSSQPKFMSNFVYKNTINSLLISFVAFVNHNNFIVPTSFDAVNSLFQYRDNLTNVQCSCCVLHAVTYLENLYFTSCDSAS